MLRTILTPLDGSTFGEHALPLALTVARHTGAGLNLLNVQVPSASVYAEPPLFIDDSDLEAHVREYNRAAGLAYLDGVVKRLKGRLASEVTPRVVEGEVRDVIRAQAESVHADLVVMTTHGRGTVGASGSVRWPTSWCGRCRCRSCWSGRAKPPPTSIRRRN